MLEAPSQPNGEQPKWSAANAKDRIAIVTTDAALDARIRAALRDEGYKFVTVPDFEAHRDDLTETICGIFDVREESVDKSLKFIRTSVYWCKYAMVGIYTKEDLNEIKQGDIMFGYRFPLDLEIDEDSIEEELASRLQCLIEILREPNKVQYHTI